ncbi:hypothetical protein DsansV1_C23g0178941 [Dioscorea sansibarensis]
MLFHCLDYSHSSIYKSIPVVQELFFLNPKYYCDILVFYFSERPERLHTVI